MSFASHDHEFINTIANRIMEITPEGLIDRLPAMTTISSGDGKTEINKTGFCRRDAPADGSEEKESCRPNGVGL